jgi:hypothetical protein
MYPTAQTHIPTLIRLLVASGMPMLMPDVDENAFAKGKASIHWYKYGNVGSMTRVLQNALSTLSNYRPYKQIREPDISLNDIYHRTLEERTHSPNETDVAWALALQQKLSYATLKDDYAFP